VCLKILAARNFSYSWSSSFFFGAKRIPDIAKELGEGIREFRKAARYIHEDVNNDIKQIDDKSEKK
jgi:sec-independent protein translocase protein TatA